MQNRSRLEITPTELADSLESGEDIQVLDVRAAHRLASGFIDAPRFLNTVGSVIMNLDDPTRVGIDREARVAVVCGHGNASLTVAAHLANQGFQALSLQGGMAAWTDVLRERVLPTPAGFDRLIQFDRIGKGALGYLVIKGDEALAVDPSRNWQVWAQAAEAAGARLVGVADTHIHADYISGGPTLSAALGVPYYLHPDDAVYPYDGTPGVIEFTPVGDGDTISVGGSDVTLHHTPGHTVGSLCFALGDEAVLTGDFLFIASIGRPDLAGCTEEWTGDLWNSLNTARDSWPRQAYAYPAHYTSDNERNEDLTIGRQLDTLFEQNPALGIKDEAEFRAFVNKGVSTPPEAYPKIKAINIGILSVTPQEVEILEAGKSECALG
jgi:glyoxylase-like metal-dependent hydrolase (beta-lactamase superfamily II)/rhodanese-related sulfurtransferase